MITVTITGKGDKASIGAAIYELLKNNGVRAQLKVGDKLYEVEVKAHLATIALPDIEVQVIN
jgi:hypothetical protein